MKKIVLIFLLVIPFMAYSQQKSPEAPKFTLIDGIIRNDTVVILPGNEITFIRKDTSENLTIMVYDTTLLYRGEIVGIKFPKK